MDEEEIGRRQDDLTADERALGMDAPITRRDFVNALAIGAGAGLLGAAAPGLLHALPAQQRPRAPFDPFTGPGGVGDYARSNGNTWDVINAGHGIRDHAYESRIAAAPATGETYDCVIVGGGFSGTMAAWRLLKDSDRKRSVLILENHPVLGGEAKRNEFLVRGTRLYGPQGSNGMASMPHGSAFRELQDDVGMPTEYEFGALPKGRKLLELPVENYYYQYWNGESESHGWFFDGEHPRWVTNPFAHELEGTPWTNEVKRDLLRWWKEPLAPFNGTPDAQRRWMDTMTYDQYLVKERGLHPEVSRFVDPIFAAAFGPTCDIGSAAIGFDLFRGVNPQTRALATTLEKPFVFSFPGGNDGLLRLILKWLNPDAIDGTNAFADVHNGKMRFEAFDRNGIPCRIRLGATVVRVAYDPARRDRPAVVTYLKDGRLHSVRARTVIWAAASWSGQYAVTGLPDSYKEAMRAFPRVPMLVVNVALDNWRALYNLGYTMASWRGGFGATANLRAPMYVGDYHPSIDPDDPTVMTFYIPLGERGVSAAEQGKRARTALYATLYRTLERRVRHQLVRMLGSAGFDARRDIAGIVTNRWGHAFNVAGPGFFYGANGKPTPSSVLREPLGVVTFAHSELSGHQSSPYSLEEAVRAARQVQGML